MLKTTILLFLISFSGPVYTQKDTITSEETPDSTNSSQNEWIKHHFLWWRSDIWYSNDIKIHKTVQRRRFIRNMFKRSVFERTQNIRFKTWDERGRLISKASLKPYSSVGRRKDVKYTYYANGIVKTKSVKIKKGRFRIKDVQKEFDEKGKKTK